MRSLVNLYRGVVPAPATHTIGVAPAVAQLAATGVAAVVTGGSQVSVPPASAGNAGVSSGASSRRSSVVGGGGGGGGGAGGDDDGEGATPAAAAPATVTGVGVAAAAAATAAAAAPAPPPSSSSSSSPPPPSLWYVGPTSSPVRTQVIQTVSILLMNINNTRSLCEYQTPGGQMGVTFARDRTRPILNGQLLPPVNASFSLSPPFTPSCSLPVV